MYSICKPAWWLSSSLVLLLFWYYHEYVQNSYESLLVCSCFHMKKHRLSWYHCLYCCFQINGRSPSACWRKVYGRIKKASVSPVIYDLNVGKRNKWKSGSYMFGFSIKKVRKLIQVRLLEQKVHFSPSICMVWVHPNHSSWLLF